MSEFAVRYSFNFRYTKDQRRSVDIPLELFVGKDLDEYTARDIVRESPELLLEMLGDQLDESTQWIRWEDWKSLEHCQRKFEIVQK